MNPSKREEAAKALFRRAQGVYREDHDHFPVQNTWETATETVRNGWRSMVESVLAVYPANDGVTGEIAAERSRQIEAEGWSPEHDDLYERHELVRAAETYLEAGRLEAITAAGLTRLLAKWPWAASWFKPRDPRRNLVKAAALIVAEIERLDRAALSPTREV